jgi:hypothetical protein
MLKLAIRIIRLAFISGRMTVIGIAPTRMARVFGRKTQIVRTGDRLQDCRSSVYWGSDGQMRGGKFAGTFPDHSSLLRG